jgi:uncharacterized protein (TIGR02271 family)
MPRRSRIKKDTPPAKMTQPIPTVDSKPERMVVPLVEEELLVNKEWTRAGEVVLSKEVEVSTETVPMELGYEEVKVQRVTVNRILEEGEEARPRQEGDTLVIPVVEEELVVLKRRVIREEVRVTKQQKVRRDEARDQVRKERIRIEPTGRISPTGEQDATGA